MFYAGDGVSDLSAARETNLLFAKEGRGENHVAEDGYGIENRRLTTETDLVTYCIKENVPFTTFPNFSTIHSTVKSIVEGKISVKDAAKN